MQTTIGDSRIGYDSRGSGIPLLLLHAFPLSRAMYDAQVDALKGLARVITLDAPGVGNSEPGPLSIDGMADLAAGVLDALQIEKAVVGGVSMGGYAALAFARRHPDRLHGLILANTRAAADTQAAREGRDASISLVTREGSAAFAEAFLPKVLGRTARKKQPKLVVRVRGLVESVKPEVITGLLRALADRADSSDLLAAITVPTLVIAAEEDELTPPDETRSWAREIAGCDLVEIPAAGHLANMEAPALFNGAVERFLSNRVSAEG